jgi:hypothetical protein
MAAGAARSWWAITVAVAMIAAAAGGCRRPAPPNASPTLTYLQSSDKTQRLNACATDETQAYLLSKIVQAAPGSRYVPTVAAGVSIKLSNVVLDGFDEAVGKAVCSANLTVSYSPAVFDLIVSHQLDPSPVKADEERTYAITYSIQPQVNSPAPAFNFDATNIGMVPQILAGLEQADAASANTAATNQAQLQAAAPVPHLIALQLQGVSPTSGGQCAIIAAVTNASVKDVSFSMQFDDAQSSASYQVSVTAAANTNAANVTIGTVSPSVGAAGCPSVDGVRNALVGALQSKAAVGACQSGAESFDDCRSNLQVMVR